MFQVMNLSLDLFEGRFGVGKTRPLLFNPGVKLLKASDLLKVMAGAPTADVRNLFSQSDSARTHLLTLMPAILHQRTRNCLEPPARG